jgi:hypothetical protein
LANTTYCVAHFPKLLHKGDRIPAPKRRTECGVDCTEERFQCHRCNLKRYHYAPALQREGELLIIEVTILESLSLEILQNLANTG